MWGPSFEGVKKRHIQLSHNLTHLKMKRQNQGSNVLDKKLRDLILDMTKVLNTNIELEDGEVRFLLSGIGVWKKLQKELAHQPV